MNNTLKGINSRVTEAEERINDLEYRMVKITVTEQNTEKLIFNLSIRREGASPSISLMNPTNHVCPISQMLKSSAPNVWAFSPKEVRLQWCACLIPTLSQFSMIICTYPHLFYFLCYTDQSLVTYISKIFFDRVEINSYFLWYLFSSRDWFCKWSLLLKLLWGSYLTLPYPFHPHLIQLQIHPLVTALTLPRSRPTALFWPTTVTELVFLPRV